MAGLKHFEEDESGNIVVVRLGDTPWYNIMAALVTSAQSLIAIERGLDLGNPRLLGWGAYWAIFMTVCRYDKYNGWAGRAHKVIGAGYETVLKVYFGAIGVGMLFLSKWPWAR